MKNLQIVKELITPEIAKEYLEKNTKNRLISQQQLARYARNMKEGKWKEDTGELIKISKTGVVLDGQHRLSAVVLSGVSIYFHIAYNVDDSVFDVIDTGKSRNAGDVFKIAGVSNANNTAAIIAHYNLIKAGRKAGANRNGKSINSELLEQYYENSDWWDMIRKESYGMYESFSRVITMSFIGGFYACFYEINKQKAEEFMRQLCTGVGVSNNVIYLLRNKMIQDRVSPKKIGETFKMALIIKSWNFFISNANVKQLMFDPNREEFPKIKN